jgi:hypothetical protein
MGMNDIQSLIEILQAQDPDLRLELDRPENPRAPWWLDIMRGDRRVVVEWRPGRGFGVSLTDRSDPLSGLFSGPDEVFEDLEAAAHHVLELLGIEERETSRQRRVALG